MTYLLISLLNKYEVKHEIQYENFNPLHKQINPSL